MENSFIPTLDEPQRDILTDSKQKLEYLISFILVNPGGTSDLHEDQMASLGTIHMQIGENPEALALAYEQKVQEAVDQLVGGNVFSVSVETANVSDTEFKLVFTFTDTAGHNVFEISRTLDNISDVTVTGA